MTNPIMPTIGVTEKADGIKPYYKFLMSKQLFVKMRTAVFKFFSERFLFTI